MFSVAIKWNEKQYTQLSKIVNFLDPFLGVVRWTIHEEGAHNAEFGALALEWFGEDVGPHFFRWTILEGEFASFVMMSYIKIFGFDVFQTFRAGHVDSRRGHHDQLDVGNGILRNTICLGVVLMHGSAKGNHVHCIEAPAVTIEEGMMS